MGHVVRVEVVEYPYHFSTLWYSVIVPIPLITAVLGSGSS